MSEDQSKYNTEETQEGLEMFWGNKPRELPSTLSGFTPAPDILIKIYGFVTALVWGRIWRYCQMSDGVCRASIEKIAGEIGMSERTIHRHVDPLVRDGYLKDSTPDRRNKPHVYVDTGKIRIKISVEATLTESRTGMTESQSAMTQSQPDYDLESHEESIKKESKKEKKKETTTAASQSVLLAYKSCIGDLTPIMIKTLTQAERLYTAEWIMDALQVAAENNVKKWVYAEKILKRWQEQGRESARSNGNGHKPTWTEIVDSDEEITTSGAAIKAKIDAMMQRAVAKRAAREQA